MPDFGHEALGLPSTHTLIEATDSEPQVIQLAIALPHPHSAEPQEPA